MPSILQFLWTPSSRLDVNVLINDEVSPVSREVVILIRFATIEFHQVGRVIRQFGFQQGTSLEP